MKAAIPDKVFAALIHARPESKPPEVKNQGADLRLKRPSPTTP